MSRQRGPGVRYVADDGVSGYADAAIRLVRGVRESGIAVELCGWSDTADGAPAALVPHSHDPRPAVQVVDDAPTVAHLVPECYPRVRGVLPHGPFVGHTVWETDRAPEHWPSLLNETDLVIVPTRWNREVFRDSGVRVPIAVVPHVACDPDPGDRGDGLALPDDVAVFYTISRWDERKAPFHTVRAFLDAFTADDPVVLVVKTGLWSEVPPPARLRTPHAVEFSTAWQIAAIVRCYRRPARIVVASEVWSQRQVAGLHHRGDVYVALTRGEGWGLGVFDAATYGNPVITTGWGGTLAYLDPHAAGLVYYRLVAVHAHAQRSYSPDQRWAEPDLDHAVDVMRWTLANLEVARARAVPLRDRIRERYAPAVVAGRFRSALGLPGARRAEAGPAF